MADGIRDTPLAEAGAFATVGGSGGIGRAIARRLAACGAVLVLGARDQVRLEQVALLPGPRTSGSTRRTSKRSSGCSRELRSDSDAWPGVVNAAGSIILKPSHLTSHDDFHETIAHNLTTAFAVVRAAGKVMTGGGSVVLFSTVAAQVAARLTANPRSLEISRAMHPLGRIGTVDNIATAACWLLDPATSWVTGQVLSVDGGLSTVRGTA